MAAIAAIASRPNPLARLAVIAAERFMVGPLAHILKNRFYIGEIVYRDEIMSRRGGQVTSRIRMQRTGPRVSQTKALPYSWAEQERVTLQNT